MSLLSNLPQVLVLAAAAVAVAALLLIWSLTATGDGARQHTLANLRRDFEPRKVGDVGGAAASRGPLLRVARWLTPQSGIRRLERLLAGAGRPATWPIERVLVTKVLLLALMAALAFLLLKDEITPRLLVISVAMVLLGFFLPEILLYNQATKRRTAIQLALPDTLDQLTIAVEAGLGFEAALAHVGRNSGGPLGDELIRTLQDIQVGAPRRVAYKALAERAQVDDLTRFVRAITQAEQYGVSVAAVLDAQAREMRVKRRQRAEEAALKIPVKVVFPLTVFILPTLVIVVLGPAVLSAIKTFPGLPGLP